MSEQQHWIMDFVESHIAQLQWSPDRTDMEKTLVAGNLRGFAALVRDKMEETYARLQPMLDCPRDDEGHDPDIDENGICRICGQYEPE